MHHDRESAVIEKQFGGVQDSALKVIMVYLEMQKLDLISFSNPGSSIDLYGNQNSKYRLLIHKSYI